MNKSISKNRAFTLTELLIVIVVIAIMAALLLPALASNQADSQRLTCINNLKQTAVAFRVWADQMGERYPMQVLVNQGGTIDLTVLANSHIGNRNPVSGNPNASRGIFAVFLVMSNELQNPKMLFCPAESEAARTRATVFAWPASGSETSFVNDLNLSYFVGVDAVDTVPQMLLIGDHNLGSDAVVPTKWYQAANGVNMSGGPYVALGGVNNIFPNPGGAGYPGWMDNTHLKQGNVGLADGSVRTFTRSDMHAALQNSGDVSHSALYGIPQGFSRIQLP